MGKGRDIELIKLRDTALLRRYVYWSDVARVRPDDVLKILSRQEFFISEERILRIICNAKKLPDRDDVQIPKSHRPRLTYKQLNLFSDDPNFDLEQIRRDSRTDN